MKAADEAECLFGVEPCGNGDVAPKSHVSRAEKYTTPALADLLDDSWRVFCEPASAVYVSSKPDAAGVIDQDRFELNWLLRLNRQIRILGDQLSPSYVDISSFPVVGDSNLTS
jgi:hypothetical protein